MSVRLFDDYVHLLAGQRAGTCATAGTCGRYFVVEGTAASIPATSLCWTSGGWESWGSTPWKNWPGARPPCAFAGRVRARPRSARLPVLPLCNGGCRRDWIGMDRNYHCAALRTFFA